MLKNSSIHQATSETLESIDIDYRTYITVLSDVYNRPVPAGSGLPGKYFTGVLIPFYFDLQPLGQADFVTIGGSATMTIPGTNPSATGISILTLQNSHQYKARSFTPSTTQASICYPGCSTELTVTLKASPHRGPHDSDPSYQDIVLSLELKYEVTVDMSNRILQGGICIVLETQDPQQSFPSMPGTALRWDTVQITNENRMHICQRDQHLFIFPAASWPGKVPSEIESGFHLEDQREAKSQTDLVIGLPDLPPTKPF